MQEVTTGMRERGIGDLQWVDREECRKKITLGTERCENINNLYIIKNIIIIIIIIIITVITFKALYCMAQKSGH